MTKVLENEQLRFSNKNKATANYAHSFKPQKAKLNKQKKRRETEKGSNNKKNEKNQEVKECKIGER